MSTIGEESVGRVLESWLGRKADANEVLVEELMSLGPSGNAAAQKVCLSCGLVQHEIPEDSLEGLYWAEKFDELAERDVASFNTLHKYSTNIMHTPFPYLDVLEACRPALLQYFGLTPDDLYLHAAFFIHYGPNWNTALRRHVDSSFLTVNICLRKEGMKGCGVRFFGGRTLLDVASSQIREAIQPSSSVVVDIPAGWALLHWGDHEHETVPWEAGERWSVILWFKER
eukprot:gnl/TRDRNA2_/TRDRNA2_160621_c0_seq2.p1 gnl/TRDRNA2_/TRDRNA2_160621_c0~~gnl/TRDRNA2_/TRDRNA2_160621_c0_seq2.p1  ORF type:complete len:228 (-),score=20.27 gnl/TRDRNA2_/TRDRNA2_160621_c0_seq2:84-767(-)